MNVANEKDIKIHYNLLGHKGQTEVRTFSNGGRSSFVAGVNNFVKLVLKLNETESVHLGINQRSWWGKTTEDVVGLNAFYFDIEGKEHTLDYKQPAFILSLKIFNELRSAGLSPVLADSGGGYHILLAFDSELVICEDNRKSVENLLNRIKQKYLDMKTDKAIVDIRNVSLGKMERIIGTVNHKHGVLSKWLTAPHKTETGKFIQWVNSLPEVREARVENIAQDNIETMSCTLLEYACSNKLPEGARNQVVCPNFMATDPTDEQIKRFANAQGMDMNEVTGWAKSDRWKGEFYCPQLRKYANETGLGYLCNLCSSCDKRDKNNIIIDLDSVSCKQSQEQLILL